MTIQQASTAVTRVKRPGRVYRPRDAADYLGLAESTLAKRRLFGGNAPPYVSLGGRAVGYLKEDMDAWLESQRRQNTSEAA